MARYKAGTGKRPKTVQRAKKLAAKAPKVAPIAPVLDIDEMPKTDFQSNIDLVKAEIKQNTANSLAESAKDNAPIAPKAESNEPIAADEFRIGTVDRTNIIGGVLFIAGKAGAWYIEDERAEIPEKKIIGASKFINDLLNILYPDASPFDPRAEAIAVAVAGIGAELGPHLKMCYDIKTGKIEPIKTVTKVENESSPKVA